MYSVALTAEWNINMGNYKADCIEIDLQKTRSEFYHGIFKMAVYFRNKIERKMKR